MDKYSVIVIGAGAGGLVVALGLAKAGKSVCLIENGNYGGDCTNFGCIPSKALIASAEVGHALGQLQKFGIDASVQVKSTDGALSRARAIVSGIREHEEPKALNGQGVHTITGLAQFVDAHTLEVSASDGSKRQVYGKQIVIATGSSPRIPAIDGLVETPYLTNETIFSLDKVPTSLAVLGGGPIGCELAQAFARLGSKVFQIHRGANLLKKEEAEAQDLLKEKFEEEKISLYLNHTPKNVRYKEGLFTIALDDQQIVQAEHFLVSVGRSANVQALQLEKAKVKFTDLGIATDRFGRTNIKHIWAVGDVTGGAIFTHVAENQARHVLASLLLPFKTKLDRAQSIPRVTYTSPEIASVGLCEKEALEKYGKENLATYFVPLSQNDRAVTASAEEGFVKVVTKKLSSKIVGATIVAPRAGEMLPELSLAMKNKVPLRKLAALIHPYPTYSLAIRKAADGWLTQTLLPSLRHPLKMIQWKRWLPLVVLVLVSAGIYISGLYRYLTFDMLKEKHQVLTQFVSDHPYLSPIVYIFLYMLVVALSLPGGALLSLIGGFLFSIPWGTIYVLVGATLGACAIFYVAKHALYDFLSKKAGPFLKKMEKGFQKNSASYLLFLRFIPLFPFWLVNIAPAFFGVRLITFAWTTFVGIIPGAYVYTQTGAGLSAIFEGEGSFSFENLFNLKLRIALVALGLFSLIPILIKKFLKKKGG